LNRYVFASRFCGSKIVLDLACGIGYGSRILRSSGSKESIGVDLSRNAIAYAGMHYPECNFFVMDATQPGFCRGIFDVICSFETIEHVRKYEKYLSEMKNLLKPGGLFIISTPLKEAWSPYGNRSANIYHIKEFSQKEFCSVIGSFFHIVGLYGQGLCSVRRFILYPYEVLTIRILGRKKVFLDKILNALKVMRNRDDLRVIPFKKSRFTVPKYIIAVCEKPPK